MRNFLILLAIILALPIAARKPIKVACVGNSVTYGYKLPDRERQAMMCATLGIAEPLC